MVHCLKELPLISIAFSAIVSVEGAISVDIQKDLLSEYQGMDFELNDHGVRIFPPQEE